MRKGNLAQLNKSGSQDRNRRGFTLPEVLLTVAILVVIFAVAVIGVSKFQQSLRQKELDSKAEIIYMAAQNRLTELAASGRSDLYTPTKVTTDAAGMTTTETLLPDVFELGEDNTPIDRKPNELTKDLFDNLYYVQSTGVGTGISTTAATILPENRVEAEIRDNYWVIEYSPDSASVYAVFYSEDRSDYTPAGYNNFRAKNIRIKENKMVGYYGGDIVKTVDTTQLTTTIDIDNAEQLIATFWSSDPFNNGVTFEITIKDKFGHEWKKTINTTTNRDEVKISEGGWAYSLTLDSLLEGERFCEVYGVEQNDGTGGLIAGSDLDITCVAKSPNKLINDGVANDTTNSLFAEIDSDGKAVITYARHLQNLDKDSGFNTEETVATKAIQKNNIDFRDDPENYDDWYTLYSGMQFKAIDSPKLDSFEGGYEQSASSTGGTGTSTTGTTGSAGSTHIRSVIYGLDTTGGLFSTFYGSTLKDVTISSGKVAGGTDNIAGGIVGKASPTNGALSVSGCQVYLEGIDSSQDEKDKYITGTKYVGGLIGQITNGNVTIEKSFAATVLGTDNTDYTGGLVGFNTSGTLTIKESYADCYLYGQSVGGLVGSCKNDSSVAVNVENSYAAGFSYAIDISAGFIASKITSSKSSYSVLYAEDEDEDVKLYGIATSGNADKTYYYEFTNEINPRQENPVGTGMTYSQMSDKTEFVKELGNAFSDQTGDTHAYNLKEGLGLSNYSYPKLASLSHYGDWHAGFESNTPVYYEVYQSDSTGTSSSSEAKTNYGFYGANISNLKDETVIGDGYGVIYDDVPKQTVELTYYKNASGETETIKIAADEAIQISRNGETYYLIEFPKEVTNTAYAASDLYQEFTVSGKTYYYCPHLSELVRSEKPTAAEKTIHVRSARQLYNLSLYYGKYAAATAAAGTTFEQQLDIDYSQYEWTTYATNSAISAQNPIGDKDNDYVFTATYNGGNHIITGVSFVGTTGYYAGLFGNNEGTLTNIAVVWDYQDDQNNKTVSLSKNIEGSTANAYMGVIAGKNSKTIRNCAVAGYVMNVSTYENSTAMIGGLVGANEGWISNSYADIPSVSLAAHYATTNFGGLVGQNTSIIQYCYAQTAVEVTESKGGEGNVKVAGFCGKNDGTIRYAYCGSSVITAGSAKGYGFTPTGGIVRECYYLNDGSYFYTQELQSYNILPGDLNVRAVTAKQLKTKATSTTEGLKGFSSAAAIEKKYNTKTVENDSGDFPYPAVYKDASGNYVHYGNWPVEAKMGGVGMLYWEYESTGANAGYHFHYIGIDTETGKGTSGTSLCTSHNDKGIITDYGYAYYIKKNDDGSTDGSVAVNEDATIQSTGKPSTTTEQGTYDNGYWSETVSVSVTTTTTNNGKFAALGDEVTKVSTALEAQLEGFDVTAYKTSDSDLHLAYDSSSKTGYDNGQFVITYTSEGNTKTNYSFTVCPFFADAFTYDGTAVKGTETTTYDSGIVRSGSYGNRKYTRTITKTIPYVVTAPEGDIATSFGTNLTSKVNKPGQNVNKYQIRSAAQLQYINWNAQAGNATSALTSKTGDLNTYFPYLKYVKENTPDRTGYNYYWTQTHDVDQQGDRTKEATWFTPIGSMYYASKDSDTICTDNKGEAYIAYMGGSYDGQSYMIKNLEIHSKHEMTGLFGITVGARLVNMVVYSNGSNTIEITKDSTGWYCVGGLAGYAAVGVGDSASGAEFENCVVSGYKILDSRTTTGGWGGACIGGLVGATNMNISKCVAVNDITINIQSDSYVKDTYRNIRVGGLVGCLRSTVDSCYSGGSIKSTSKEHNPENYDGDTSLSIWTGGINGSIIMVEYGLSSLIGNITGEVTISNSYSYVELQPRGTNQIKSAMPLASLGEMLSYKYDDKDSAIATSLKDGETVSLDIKMYNCYAYADTVDNSEAADLYKNSSNSKYWDGSTAIYTTEIKGDATREKHIFLNNSGERPYLTFEQLSASESTTSNGLKSGIWLLKNNGTNCGVSNADFGFVTTVENGSAVNGKYSYPGDATELDGANYPFPTILKQIVITKIGSTESTDRVNVHYGRWPKGDMFWSTPRLSFDILEMFSDGKSSKSLTLTAGADVEFKLYTEMGEEITDESKVAAEVGDKTRDAENGTWNVVINALRVGTTKIRALQDSGQGDVKSYTDLMVSITANMTLASDPKQIEINIGDEPTTVQLTNTNVAIETGNNGTVTNLDKLKDYSAGTTWRLTVDDQNVATVTAPELGTLGTSGLGCHTFTIKGETEGETTITAVASYTVMGQTYTEKITIPVSVNKRDESAESSK